MGTKTTNFGLYKPDLTEVVNVELDLNNNLEICDREWKSLFEYKLFRTSSVSANPAEPKKKGYRWYKSFNSSVGFWGNDSAFHQDSTVVVPTWNDLTPDLNGTYVGMGALGSADWPYYTYLDRGGVRDVRLAGKVVLASGAELPLNTSTNIGTLISALRPVVPKTFQVYAGASATYSIARVSLATSGVISFTRMGANTTDATQRYIDLDGIRYSTDTPA